MSILDALKVQKASQQSVRELAALPQDQIIRMAQMGQIPADVLPVVINEKARMTRDMAQLKAAMQQQGPMPTVIEQAMQTNAQAEMPQAPATPAVPQGAPQMQMPPQAPPQAAPQEAGVAGLPTGQMFQGQNFQAGGIVGYNGEEDSFVQTPGGLNVLKSEVAAQSAEPGKRPSSLAEFIQQVSAESRPYKELSAAELELEEARKKGMLSDRDKQDQKWMRLMQAGLGIMGGESPHALTNIGKGSQEALKGYGEDLKEQRKQQMDDLKARAEAAKAKRLEGMEDVKTGAALYKEYMESEAAAQRARDNQLGAKYADNYVAMRKAGGDTRPDEVLRDEGYRRFFQEYGFASGRAATQQAIATGNQGVQMQGIDQQAYGLAVKEFNDLKMSDPIKREYNRLFTIDKKNREAGNPTDLAEQYKRQEIDKYYRKRASSSTPGASSGATATSQPAAESGGLPAQAAAQLKKGVVTSFANGQKWTLDENGKPKQVK